MYLTRERIEKCADEVMWALGKQSPVRDVVYGGTEYVGLSYGGYGLLMWKDSNCPRITIKYDMELVYDKGGEVYHPGEWELVLEKVYRTIPMVKAQREAEREAKERKEEELRKISHRVYLSVRDLPLENGVYHDDKIYVVSDGGIKIKVYEIYYAEMKYLFKTEYRQRKKLVYDSEYMKSFVDGDWLDYLARVAKAEKERSIREYKRSQPSTQQRLAELSGIINGSVGGDDDDTRELLEKLKRTVDKL